MTETLTQRLLAAVFDDAAIGDDLVRDLALSSDAHGELVRLAAVLAGLPGDGARAAEQRLDRLLDDVSLAAARESRTLASSDAMPRLADPQLAARLAELPPAPERVRNARGLVVAGAALAAAAVVAVIAWPSREGGVTTPHIAYAPQPPAVLAEAPAPAPRPQALVHVEIRVSPASATISIDGKEVDGNPFAGQYTRDDGVVHRIRATAPGYVSKVMSIEFSANVVVDLTLERSVPTGAVAVQVPAGPPPAQVSAGPPPARVAVRNVKPDAVPPPRPRRVMSLEPREAPPPARVADAVPNADELYRLGYSHYQAHDYAAALSTFERWLAASSATDRHHGDVEQMIARLRRQIGKVAITTTEPNCEISIDGLFVGTTPLREPLLVSVGDHRVTAACRGPTVQVRFARVPADRADPLELSFTDSGERPAAAVKDGKLPPRPIDAAGGQPPPPRPIDPADPYSPQQDP